jgi:transcriptional regulator with XRE-family HTH domain
MNSSEKPYKNLGDRLKRLREQASENLPELSGALEIDVETLVRIEKGAMRPSEETLLLLVTHFGIRDDEASRLWALAGYAPDKIPVINAINEGAEGIKPMVMVMADSRIVYTDAVHVMVNNFGVVMNFMQNSGTRNQPMAIARIGMSKEHAKSVLDLLSKTLAENTSQVAPKQLPSPKKQNNQN